MNSDAVANGEAMKAGADQRMADVEKLAVNFNAMRKIADQQSQVIEDLMQQNSALVDRNIALHNKANQLAYDRLCERIRNRNAELVMLAIIVIAGLIAVFS